MDTVKLSIKREEIGEIFRAARRHRKMSLEEIQLALSERGIQMGRDGVSHMLSRGSMTIERAVIVAEILGFDLQLVEKPMGKGKGPVLAIVRDRADRPTLQEAQEFVGGYIEVIHTPAGDQVLVNEDGLMLDLPANDEARAFLAEAFGVQEDRIAPIVGAAIVLQGEARWD
jgi:hypothetical protein